LLHEEKNIKGFVSLFIYWYKLKIREVRYPSFGVCYRTMIMRGIVLPTCYCYDKLKSRRKGALPLPSFVPILNNDKKEGEHMMPFPGSLILYLWPKKE
jgi:hypothetical protein